MGSRKISRFASNEKKMIPIRAPSASTRILILRESCKTVVYNYNIFEQ
jgi:hypothetical protein